ncbi:hypothetical protein L0244_40990, partial [bacterium]|nr:hypothetical protein [bacterium]
LTLLREYREQVHKTSPSNDTKLRHITVVEEAHNVLENIKSTGDAEGGGANTRYKAVQAFCAMLAEIRALGEGLIIADQSPEKLAPDALRNTNIQITHQLRYADDRAAMANAMIMTDEQQEYLAKLKPGHAGVFYTGLQRASFVRVPQFDGIEDGYEGRGSKYRAVVMDDEVEEHMRQITAPIKELDRPFQGCYDCGHFTTCDFRWQSRAMVKLDNAGTKMSEAFSKKTVPADRAKIVSEVLKAGLANSKVNNNQDAPWCYLLHLRHAYIKKPDQGGPSDKLLRVFFEKQVLPLLKKS